MAKHISIYEYIGPNQRKGYFFNAIFENDVFTGNRVNTRCDLSYYYENIYFNSYRNCVRQVKKYLSNIKYKTKKNIEGGLTGVSAERIRFVYE